MSEQAFPPEDPGSFLSLCDGEWMSLRSCFELAAGGDDEWHSSERGELTVRCVSEQGALGQLQVQAPGGTNSTRLRGLRGIASIAANTGSGLSTMPAPPP